jgi:hypothetical protein
VLVAFEPVGRGLQRSGEFFESRSLGSVAALEQGPSDLDTLPSKPAIDVGGVVSQPADAAPRPGDLGHAAEDYDTGHKKPLEKIHQRRSFGIAEKGSSGERRPRDCRRYVPPQLT